VAAYEARNVLITRKGALGILSNQTRDAAGSKPLKEGEKKEVQEDFQKYGLGKDQYQVIITNANLKWQPMTFSTKDLMLMEELEDSTRAIADNLDYPMYLLGFKEGSTFSNVGEQRNRFIRMQLSRKQMDGPRPSQHTSKVIKTGSRSVSPMIILRYSSKVKRKRQMHSLQRLQPTLRCLRKISLP
jgi:hypothetical protein